MQLYHEMALHLATIAEPTVLDNGDTVPCPFPWSSGVEPAPALVLLVWMVHCYFLCMSQSICVGWADNCKPSCSQSSSVEPFGGLYKSTLDDFLKSDRNYLQFPRLLSQFKSIDHKKNILLHGMNRCSLGDI